MSSGLIYFAVVAMWVAYFLPRWLRTHDEISDNRSLERYQSAMSLVSLGTSHENLPSRTEVAENKIRQMRQRQLIFVGLAALFLIVFISTLFGGVPFKTNALPISLILIYVIHVRRQKIVEEVSTRRRLAAARATNGVRANFSDVLYRSNENATEHWIPLRPSTTVTVIPNTTWQPSEVPLPTYVTAAKAVSRPIKEVPIKVEVAVGPDEIFDQVAIEEADLRAAN
jgi:hypothetical protein